LNEHASFGQNFANDGQGFAEAANKVKNSFE
jgi:hypothetical protein